ncbi:MAG TPA: hypothetical protein VK663_09395 [Burkholderiales bacterium]|nr:hypothetical protein [Burkholderiales bacterium]
MKITIILAALTMTALSGIASAQTPATTPSDARGARIDQRQANQQERIDRGINSGQLTPRETVRLEKGQAHVQKMEDKARADGKVTKSEARHIERAQDRQSARIYDQKHDKQKAVK